MAIQCSKVILTQIENQGKTCLQTSLKKETSCLYLGGGQLSIVYPRKRLQLLQNLFLTLNMTHLQTLTSKMAWSLPLYACQSLIKRMKLSLSKAVFKQSSSPNITYPATHSQEGLSAHSDWTQSLKNLWKYSPIYLECLLRKCTKVAGSQASSGFPHLMDSITSLTQLTM